MAAKLNKTAGEIARIVNGRVSGNSEIMINNLNRIEDAVQGELTFFSDKKYEKYLETTGASCIIVPDNFDKPEKEGIAYIYSAKPYIAFVMLLKYVDSLKENKHSFIHPTAIIDETAKIDPSAYIGPYCVIGRNCFIKSGCVLHSNIAIYDDVEIGENTILYSNVTCYSDTIIGKNCIIHAGAVIGSDGFGNVEMPDGSYEKIPQLGNVIVGNNVEVGANTTIDCALVGSTVIEDGVKLDNLIHIGHNVRVGENTAMAAQVGISGSTKVGKRNRLGGQVGLSGHIETADDVIILAQSGVAKSVEKKGMYFGSPIKDRLHAFKIEAIINKLPELAETVWKIEKKINETKD